VTLDGKVAVVTGGGSGLGEAISMRLAHDGARVAVLDVNLDAATVTAELAGGVAAHADVSDSASVDRALAEVEQAVGPVDIWVNNAGIAAAAQVARIGDAAERQLAEAAQAGAVTTPLDALVRLPDEEWRVMLAVHLDGTFFGTRAAARSMAARGRGVIVNIASVCGVEGCTGYPHYSAAKAGVIGFTRAVAKELAVQGIRVNVVAPGFLESPGTGIGENVLRTAQRLRTPLGRFGRSEEIAGTVAFLASDDAAYFVGATLNVNGGLVTT
jgi:3-oxoacyl-[acyl-carrier protein] reductase